MFFFIIFQLFVYLLAKNFPSHKIFSKNKFWKYVYPQKLIFIGFGPKKAHLKNPIDFLFTFQPITKQTADVNNILDGIE